MNEYKCSFDKYMILPIEEYWKFLEARQEEEEEEEEEESRQAKVKSSLNSQVPFLTKNDSKSRRGAQ
jgi:hypothetical protein